MHLRSLHSRVNLVLFVLTITLLVQVALTYNSFSVLISNQVDLSQLHRNVGAIYELEQNVIDLQRNLLIYKETASASSIQGFHLVMANVNKKIKKISSEVGDGQAGLIDNATFLRMSDHIKSYEENFSSVIQAKTKQKKSIERLEIHVQKLTALFEYNQKSSSVKIKGNILDLSQLMNKYINTLDPEEIENFNILFINLNNSLKKNKIKKDTDILSIIKKEFKRLIQYNRGYLYLVNVVMSGEAGEILYLTKDIRKKAVIKKEKIERETYHSSRNTQLFNSIVGGLFIFIILSSSWFLSRKILLPIKNITDVFSSLSKGETVSEIPNIDNQNEIGNLARAAEVFHRKNELTRRLLVESREMVDTQKIMNYQLEQQKKKAEIAAESKSMFLANMSHEIRTPMNGIVGLVDLVLDTDLTEKQKAYLDRIAYSGQIMMNVINDILDFSKIEAGKMQVEQVEFNVNDIIENVISSIITRVNEQSLDFKVWVNPEVPVLLKGDPLRISQILLNLSSNAIKFTEQGSIVIKFDYSDNQLYFSVHDTGIGMNAQQVDSIFDSFTQADGSISRKYGGTGLGLTIVEKLVALMHGTIKVESHVDVGTDVFVQVQCEALTDEPVMAPFIPPPSLIHYIGRNGKPTVFKHVLEKLNIPLDDASALHKTLQAQKDFPKFDIIIFEGINTLDESTILFCKKSKASLLCIANSNEFLESTNDTFDNITLLHHPFSPNQYQRFLNNVFGFDKDQARLISDDQKSEHVISGHVLLVEDNEINQMVAGDMLDTLGVSFDLAENGIEAIAAVEKSHYDLVLMDVQMPKMDGYTATKALRESGITDLIICGLSANALKEDLERATQSGMNDYLTKPLTQDSLKIMLEKYLTSK